MLKLYGFVIIFICSVFLQFTGQNTHLLLSILIKHLEHKNVIKHPDMQLNIVEVATTLVQHTKIQPSVTINGAVSELMRHLRKSTECALDANQGTMTIKRNTKFRAAVDECLVQFTKKVVFYFFISS